MQARLQQIKHASAQGKEILQREDATKQKEGEPGA